MNLCIGLTVIALTASAVSAETMTDSEAREICTDVARLESDRKLDALVLNLSRVPTVEPTTDEQALIDDRHQSRVDDTFRLEITRGKPILFVSVSNGGTCQNHGIYPVTRQADEISEGDENFEDDEPSIGGEDEILQRDGRFFLINRNLDSGRLRNLAWITPAGRVQPMCSFETERVVRSVANHRAPLALCEALLEAPASAVWRPYEHFDAADPEALRQAREITGVTHFDSTPEMETARIDVDNDGDVDDVVRLSYTNSWSCGYLGSRLQLLDSARNRIASDPLNEALHMASRNGDPIEIYTIGKGQYVLANSETDGRVYSITGKGAEQQCVFNHRHVLRVTMRR